MAKKKQQITEERNLTDEIVENVVAPENTPVLTEIDGNNVVAPSASTVEANGNTVTESDVAEAVLEKETTAVADSVALDSDPVNRPV
ncbi:MAG: hypothetical protein K2L54_06045, partial [Clostridiales bacterium]|nr:hypothetical protein [Clostridiales bacterium]